MGGGKILFRGINNLKFKKRKENVHGVKSVSQNGSNIHFLKFFAIF